MLIKFDRTVEATAPTRVDLAGGTLDIWPLYLFHPGAVTINAAVNLPAKVRIKPIAKPEFHVKDRKLGKNISWPISEAPKKKGPYPLFSQTLDYFSINQGLAIEFYSEAPKGAGLAGSSALLVALCGALIKGAHQPLSKERFLRVVRDIETRLIKVPAGMQDYYPALYGGVQALWWQEGGARRENVTISSAELEKRLILVYTGTSRYSGTNNWEVFKQHLDGHRKVHRLFGRISEAAQAMVAAMEQEDYDALGKAMALESRARKELFPGIVTPEILELERLATRQGAIAVKVCGAGGGGCVAVYVDPEQRQEVENRIREKGYFPLSYKVSRKGLSFPRKASSW